jgi:hypothetical protein
VVGQLVEQLVDGGNIDWPQAAKRRVDAKNGTIPSLGEGVFGTIDGHVWKLIPRGRGGIW